MPTQNQRPHPSGKVVSVRLKDETIAYLDELAERTGRSRGFYLRMAVENLLPIVAEVHWEDTVKEFERDQTKEAFIKITQELMEEFNKNTEN